MTFILASCPSNKDAAVTILTLCFGEYDILSILFFSGKYNTDSIKYTFQFDKVVFQIVEYNYLFQMALDSDA